MLDSLRVILAQFMPPFLPYLYQAWYRSKREFGYGRAVDPVKVFLEGLPEILVAHPELLAEIINTPRYREHFKDITFTEAAAAAAAEDKLNETV